MLRCLWGAAIVLALLAPAAAMAQQPLSTEQLTALNPSAANRTVQKDLLSMLQPIDHISSGMMVRLRGVGLKTRAYGAGFDGLCRQDTLWLLYAPTDLSGPARKQPVQPYGIEASAAFYALRTPTAESQKPNMSLDIWRADCDQLSDDTNAFWFSAKDALEAAKAVSLLQAAKNQIRAGDLKPGSCDVAPLKNSSCAQTIANSIDLKQISSVSACDAPPGSECYVIEVGIGGGLSLKIIGRLAAEGLAPARVESITAAMFVVVT